MIAGYACGIRRTLAFQFCWNLRCPVDEESQGQLQNVLCRKPYRFKLLCDVDSILSARGGSASG